MKREDKKLQKQELNGVSPGDGDYLIQKRIAMRAYELYLQRGGVDGRDEEDWLQAEQEILEEEHH